METIVQDFDELQTRAFREATAVTTSAYPPASRLEGEHLVRFLDGHRFAVIATSRPDGRPHATPGSYIAAPGPSIWLPTGAGTQRARHLRSSGWVSLVIDEGDRGEHAVVITEGPATLATEPSPEARERWTARDGTLPGWAEVWIRVDPVRLFSYAADGSRWAPPA